MWATPLAQKESKGYVGIRGGSKEVLGNHCTTVDGSVTRLTSESLSQSHFGFIGVS